MKKLIALTTFLGTLQAIAVCQNSNTIYMEESDDDGVSLNLDYTCTSQNNDEICVYSKGKFASIAGTLGGNYISTSELYRRSYEKTKDKIYISSMTSFWDSIFDHRDVKFILNLESVEGHIKMTGDGVDPYSTQTKSTLQVSLKCSLAK